MPLIERWNKSEVAWKAPKSSRLAWPRILLRAFMIIFVTFALLPIFVLIRFARRPFGRGQMELEVLRLWGLITCFFWGLKPRIHGERLKTGGVVMPNHVSFLDGSAVYAAIGAFMMPKIETRSWPVIGWLFRVLGSEFINRDRSAVQESIENFANRLAKGDRMVVFPEGSTTDGLQVTPFRSTLFASMDDPRVKGYIQPVALYFHPPKGASDNFYGWWGEMKIWPTAKAYLSIPGRRIVDISLCKPVAMEGDRKTLAKTIENIVRDEFERLKRQDT